MNDDRPEKTEPDVVAPAGDAADEAVIEAEIVETPDVVESEDAASSEPAGELEPVPLKVVPMYIETDDPPTEAGEPVEAAPAPRRPRTKLVGILALVVAVAAAVLQGVGIGVATGGDYPLASALAYGAIVASILAFVAALVAVLGGFGRRWGVAALVIAVFANPVVLLALLSWVGGA